MSNKDPLIKNRTNLEYYYRHQDRLKEKQRLRSAKEWDDPIKKEKKKAAQLKWRQTHPEQAMWTRAQQSAKKRGLEFTISPEDIIIPEYCPIFNIKLEQQTGNHSHASPSLDRKDNSRGYIKGNIWVISHRANTLKKDASLEELELLVLGLRKLI